MKHIYWLFVLSVIVGCNNNKTYTGKDFQQASWIVLDSATSYFIAKDGDGIYKENNLFVYELSAVIDKRTGSALTVTEVDSIKMQDLHEPYMTMSFKTMLTGKIKKNSEGYLKVDFLKMPDNEFKISVYFGSFVSDTAIKSLITYLKSIKEIVSIRYISPEAALEKYSADNNDTSWKHIISTNPLPASVDIILFENDVNRRSVKKISDLLKAKFAFFSDIIYSDRVLDFNEVVAGRLFIFRFKT